MLHGIRRKIVSHINRERTVTYRGRPFRIPLRGEVGGENLEADAREGWMDHYLDYALAPSATLFVDVGVNVGQTLLKVQAAKPGTRYVGFEANVTCAAYVAELLELNRLDGCTVVPLGLSCSAAFARLLMSARADPSASIVEGYRESGFYSGPSRLVPLMTGDAYFDQFPAGDAPMVIKIDVEGAEQEVLRGLSCTITSSRPDIVCEILPIYELVNRSRLEQNEAIWTLLAEQEYRIFRLLPEPGTAEPVEQVQVHGDLRLTNYAFVPIERTDRFSAAYRLMTARA